MCGIGLKLVRRVALCDSAGTGAEPVRPPIPNQETTMNSYPTIAWKDVPLRALVFEPHGAGGVYTIRNDAKGYCVADRSGAEQYNEQAAWMWVNGRNADSEVILIDTEIGDGSSAEQIANAVAAHQAHLSRAAAHGEAVARACSLEEQDAQ